MLTRLQAILVILAGSSLMTGTPAALAQTGWPLPGGAVGGGHYSAADQITRENVAELEVAWIHRSGDYQEGANFRDGLEAGIPLQSSWQATPILIDDHLVVCTPFNRIIAVDAASGQESWSYTPGLDLDKFAMPRCRGVTQWRDKRRDARDSCATVVIAPLMDARIIGLDAKTGARCHFGASEQIDLRIGVGAHAPGDYMLNTPPAVAGDLLVTGASVVDNLTTDVPGGVVRAYDLRSGERTWFWEPLRADGSAPPLTDRGSEPGSDGDQPRFRRGTTNVWSFISIDPELGLVYVPTGNTAPDYYGGHRDGLDDYSSSIVALDLYSGELAWHFQTVHHDIWDFDVPSQPTLFDIQRNGALFRGLAQTTKQGYVFLLNRETGEPLFPVVETPMPQGTVEGDFTAPTQPVPSRPRSLFDFPLDRKPLWGLTPWDRGACENILDDLRYEGLFTPPSLKGSLHMPSAFGGQNWGGPALDPDRSLLIVNTLHVGSIVQLLPREQCSEDTLPDPVAPGPFLVEPSEGTPYCDRRWLGFVSPLGAPCTPPPWGTLAAIELGSGDVRWQVPLGTSRDMAPFPFWFIKGAPNLGGPVTTATGLTFIAATTDHFLRAFDTQTGDELWKERLPTSAHGLPITYQLASGDQYVTVAAGGHAALGTPPGDYLISFRLKRKQARTDH